MGAHGRYQIIRKVADGGMAEIFLARQSGAEGFNRLVIVKRILPALSADPHFRNMFVDEAHIAMTLNHSNIVPVLDLGQSEGRYFLVLELVDGWDLATVSRRAREQRFTFPLGLALYVAAQICRGLAYAHGTKGPDGKFRGIVHRDISPQNVLLSEHGEIKVTDFGIAMALGKRERTQTGIIKGKLDFMSPEQASGVATDAASDIFSVGTMLYLLATGRRPFACASDLEALAKVQKADFVPPEEVTPGLSHQVARIINRAMQLEAADRYPSAEDMMLDVEAVMRDEFSSPGQSELKRWLADLGARDHALPISRLPGISQSEPLPDGWFKEGDMLSFDDESDFGSSPPTGRGRAGRGAPVSPFGATEMQVTPVRRPPRSGPHPGPRGGQWRRTPSPSPIRPRPLPPPPPPWRRIASWATGAVLCVAGLAFLMDRWVPYDRKQELQRGAQELVEKSAKEVNSALEAVKNKVDPTATSHAQDNGDQQAVGAPASGRAGRPGKPTQGRRADRRRMVTIDLITTPAGASVVGPDGSMGTTPFKWRVPVGTRQFLTFAKPGFKTVTREIYAGPSIPRYVVDLPTPPRGR